MSTADGLPLGATGNLQSAQVVVLFGSDPIFILHTKCAQKKSFCFDLEISIQMTFYEAAVERVERETN